MLKEESSDVGGGGRVCETCRSAACTVYCRADSAYLCGGCDARVHAANRVASRHERVWMCEACERAPAAFLCKADAASLCATCDAEIHSANPLASRHQRVPVLPISGSLYGHGDDEAASWLLLNKTNNNQNNGFLFGGEVDEYLEMEYNSSFENQFTQQQQQYGVVPGQSGEAKHHLQHQQHQMDNYNSSKAAAAYSYNGSISHSVRGFY